MEYFKSLPLVILFITIICPPFINCNLHEMTINVDPRKEDCFFQPVKQGDVIDIEYQVIDGGHGDLDITFHVVDPTSRILVADYKKPENSHELKATMDGDYKFCFDNTFSSYNVKTIFFELVVEKEGETDWSDEDLDLQHVRPTDVLDIKIQDVEVIIFKLRSMMTKVRQFQDLIKSSEARDRNVAEENYFKVNTFSFIQITIMLAVGGIQVILLRSLFDDRSKVSKIWKTLDRR